MNPHIQIMAKAVAAFLTSAAGLAALFGLNPEIATAENIAAAASVVAAIVGAVWKVPNRIEGRNVVELARGALVDLGPERDAGGA